MIPCYISLLFISDTLDDKYKDFIPPEDKSFTYSIDTANTHNMGLYSLRNNEWTRNLFKLIIDRHEEREKARAKNFSLAT